MDINKAFSDWRAGKLRDYSVSDLRAMSAGCVVFIQNRVPDTVQLQAAIESEILRKEMQEAEQRGEQRHHTLVSEQRSLKVAVESLARPHWVVWATFVVGAVAAIAAVILLFR